MSDASEIPWSDNPNAPQIPYALYFAEKANFAGALVGAIFYGIRTICARLSVLIDPPFQVLLSSFFSNVWVPSSVPPTALRTVSSGHSWPTLPSCSPLLLYTSQLASTFNRFPSSITESSLVSTAWCLPVLLDTSSPSTPMRSTSFPILWFS